MACTVYIDESGDAGIRTVRSDEKPGASPYFVLAAAVMPSATKIVARQMLLTTQSRIGKSWRHATDLNHSQTVFFCRSAIELNLRFFAIVSKKSTLGSYADGIGWEPHKFYNKCTHYLLECVGRYLAAKGELQEDIDVVFEGRNHDFDALRRYIGKIKENPLHTNANHLKVFNPFGFVERAKHEDQLLKFADLAAHSVYQCVNKIPSNFDIPEPRYMNELRSRFGTDQNGKILGVGLKCIHSIDQIGLDAEIKSTWESLRGKPRASIRR